MKMRDFEMIARKAIEDNVKYVEFDDGGTYNAIDVMLTDGDTKDTFFVDVHVTVKRMEFYGKIWDNEGIDYSYGNIIVEDTSFRASQPFDMDLDDIEDAVEETAVKAVRTYVAKFTKG